MGPFQYRHVNQNKTQLTPNFVLKNKHILKDKFRGVFVFLAERAGFEYYLSMGAREPKIKKTSHFQERFFWRRGRDSNPRTFVGYTLSKRAR